MFADGCMKVNWHNAFAAANNLESRGLYGDLLRAPEGGCAVWVALFSTIEANWVKGEPWQQIPLHCWAVALIPRADGRPRRALLIYNVDPIQPDPAQFSEPRALERTRSYLSGTQNSFLERCRRDKVVDDVVWHNADTRYAGRDECLQRSIDWIQPTDCNSAESEDSETELASRSAIPESLPDADCFIVITTCSGFMGQLNYYLRHQYPAPNLPRTRESSVSERRSDIFKQLEAIFYALKRNRPYGNVRYRIVDLQLALRDCLQWTSLSRNTVLDAYVPHGNSQEHERMFLERWLQKKGPINYAKAHRIPVAWTFRDQCHISYSNTNQIIAILIALKECWHSAHWFLSATPWPSSPCNIKAFIKLTETRTSVTMASDYPGIEYTTAFIKQLQNSALDDLLGQWHFGVSFAEHYRLRQLTAVLARHNHGALPARFNHEYLKELGRKFKQDSAKGDLEGLDFIADINSSYENLTQRHTRGRTLAMLRSLWNRWNTSSSKRTGWKLGIAWDTWMRVQQLRILVGTAFTDGAMRTGISKKTIAIVEVKARTRIYATMAAPGETAERAIAVD
ncbi:hypothetical protein ATEIFO6365_0009018000 [Aspergillus terreus]|uniref:Uncharacterized protein n=1 Tax=Aspergillus terreus TaxID=33178 RepID=A0A5M3ZBZ1_ASPTE|nr:hypothetical protein ATETN484_0011018000 [Aspergillus terreus]GFF18817.1 hypothetical protein ATEIFO6365_0009018000 [Aspergillus terreus]